MGGVRIVLQVLGWWGGVVMQKKLSFGLEGPDERKWERLLSEIEMGKSESKEERGGGEMRFVVCWAGVGGVEVLEFVVDCTSNVLL